MKAADLDTITSKSIRFSLEKEMGRTLEEYKSFIDKVETKVGLTSKTLNLTHLQTRILG